MASAPCPTINGPGHALGANFASHSSAVGFSCGNSSAHAPQIQRTHGTPSRMNASRRVPVPVLPSSRRSRSLMLMASPFSRRVGHGRAQALVRCAAFSASSRAVMSFNVATSITLNTATAARIRLAVCASDKAPRSAAAADSARDAALPLRTRPQEGDPAPQKLALLQDRERHCGRRPVHEP